jgi:hypothetical protein
MALPSQSTPKLQKRNDSFSTKNNGPYNVTNLAYPAEISERVDMQHYVTFFINVRGKSKVFKNNPALPNSEITSVGENRIDNRNGTNYTTAAGGLAGGVIGAGLVRGTGVASALVTRFGGGGKAKLGALVAGAVTGTAVAGGAVLGAAAANLLVKADTTYRIQDCITLHVSQAPSAHYSAQYGNPELGALAGFLTGGDSITDSMKDSARNIEGARALAISAMKIPGKLISTGNVKSVIESTTKQTLNPYREVLFQSIGFRKFAFEYKFMPKSQAETDAVQKIIQTFKYHMHPELSEGRLYFIHPSEFNIQYYFKGKENKYFNKMSTCVLEDMHVDYGGQEGFTSFRDGAPVEIGMRLVFQELETLTKDRVEEGF